MKRIVALILAALTVLFVLTGCTKIGEDGNGAIIDVYMGTKTINLDPATAYTDENSVKILSLLFQGLVNIKPDGSVEKALAKKWEFGKTNDGFEKMTIWINDTYWSDGSQVQANDIVYAWKRILDPEFNSSAASMLFAIQGAKDAKHGKIGIDDIGLYSLGTTKFEVIFEDGADKDEFITNMGSIALVPLRENKVEPYASTWSYSSRDLSTNGPFRVKKFTGISTDGVGDMTSDIILERSKYYYLKQDVSTEEKDKYVYPYRIVFHFNVPLDFEVVSSSADTDVIEMYRNKDLFYVSNLTAETIGNFTKKEVKYDKLSSTYSYIFNTSHKALADPNVRYALTLALDRTYCADLVGCGATAASGLIPTTIFDTKKGTSFRKKAGNAIGTGDGYDEACAVLDDCGINPSKFEELYLYYRADETNDSYASASLGFYSKEKALATYAKEVWEELGFKVVLKAVNAKEYEEALKSRAYDIIGLDYQMLSPYPFYDLAAFSTDFSGYVDMSKLDEEGSYVSVAGLSGYSSAEYNELIEKAYAEKNAKEKANILHEAEKLLIEDGAICPVIFNCDAYVVSGELSGLTTNFWGAKIFTKAVLKNYEKYLPSAKVKEEE